MSRQGAWLWRLALLVSVSAATVAWAADPDDDADEPAAPKKTNKVWVNTWFMKNQQPKPIPQTSTDAAKAKTPKPPPKRDPAQDKRMRELHDYLRRMAVCDQLTQIALETRDQDLMKQAEQLKERVWLTYKLRTVGPRNHSETDEKQLDQRLGARTTANDQAYEPLLGNSRDKDASSLTALKEDNRR